MKRNYRNCCSSNVTLAKPVTRISQIYARFFFARDKFHARTSRVRVQSVSIFKNNKRVCKHSDTQKLLKNIASNNIFQTANRNFEWHLLPYAITFFVAISSYLLLHFEFSPRPLGNYSWLWVTRDSRFDNCNVVKRRMTYKSNSFQTFPSEAKFPLIDALICYFLLQRSITWRKRYSNV